MPRARGRYLLESRRFLAGALIAPAVLFIVLLVGVPLGLAVYLAFTDATSGSLSGNWVGFQNFVDEWHNEIFRRSLWNTALFTVASQAVVLLGAGILAHALVRDFRGNSTFAEQAVADPTRLVDVPDGVDDTVAAACARACS